VSNAFAEIMSPVDFEEMSLRICAVEDYFENFSRSEFHFRSGTEARELAKLYNTYEPFFSREIVRVRPNNEARETEFQMSVRGLLGAERYAVWERSQDASYQEIWDFGRDWALPRDTILKVWQVRREAEQEFSQLSERADLSAVERSAAWLNVRQQTEAALASLLGGGTGAEYLKSHGAWLNVAPNTPREQ